MKTEIHQRLYLEALLLSTERVHMAEEKKTRRAYFTSVVDVYLNLAQKLLDGLHIKSIK